MGGEEEDGLSPNGGGQQNDSKCESSSPVNNSKACGQTGGKRAEPWTWTENLYSCSFQMIFIGPVKPKKTLSNNRRPPHKVLPKVELRNQSIMLDDLFRCSLGFGKFPPLEHVFHFPINLFQQKTVSPPKFKPCVIGDMSDYQHQINGSKGMQEFSNILWPLLRLNRRQCFRNVPYVPSGHAMCNEMIGWTAITLQCGRCHFY
ncbi:hypothetical protein niasHT_030998 [Heterodera trifolii]|uniref:Uncharacterized protein n=1 Tax=Heterodera trifolii TaxID=157864 RepID=A0ABD2I247_9BILA